MFECTSVALLSMELLVWYLPPSTTLTRSAPRAGLWIGFGFCGVGQPLPFDFQLPAASAHGARTRRGALMVQETGRVSVAAETLQMREREWWIAGRRSDSQRGREGGGGGAET